MNVGLSLLLAWPVYAAEPHVAVSSDHTVDGSIVVAAPLNKVRALLADPTAIARLDNNGTTVTVRGTDGTCQRVHTAVEHPVASIDYEAKVCPTSEGWKAELVQSAHLQAFSSEWNLTPSGDGTRIRYRVRTVPDIPVPQFIVDRQSKSSVAALLVKLRTHFDGA